MLWLIPRRPLPRWQGLLVAITATAAAWGGRAALAPVVLDQSPYHLFFAAILVTGLLAGWKSASLTAIAGGLLANRSFVPPYGEFMLSGKYGWGLALYALTAALIIWLTHAVTASLRREAALSDHLAMVSKEYRHRIKNLLAMAQALVQQTGRYTPSKVEFQEKIVERMQALARAQDLLSLRGDENVALRALLDDVLKPFNAERRLTAPLAGPEVEVSSDQAVALALLLNELATNATKYGAFSTPEGRLTLGWSVEDSHLLIEWRERNGPPVTEPEKRGFGSRLFDRAMAPFSGSAKTVFAPEGLICEIRLTINRQT